MDESSGSFVYPWQHKIGEIEAALPCGAWQIISLEKLTKYFEIFQGGVLAYPLLKFNVCRQSILSDTVDNFTLAPMPPHGDLCDFLQKLLRRQNLL